MAGVNIVSLLLFLNIGFCLSCSEGNISELLSRIKALEDRETVNAARIYHLENQVKNNNEKYEIIRQENIILKNDLIVRTNKLDQMERMIADLNHEIGGIKKRQKKEHAVVDSLNKHVIQMHKTTFIHAIQPNNNALNDHAGIFSNNNETDKFFNVRNELSNSHVNRNITKNTIPSTQLPRQAHKTLKLVDANLDIKQSRTIKRPDFARQNRQQNDIVAFHAVLLTRRLDHLGTNENIKFDHVHLNEGNGYHNQHGLFIAPRSGIYLFSLTLTNYYTTEFWADLVKNGQALASVLGGEDGNKNQGSVTLITQLKAGDEVWVRHTHPIDGIIWGNNYSSFCGVLLIPE